MQEALDAQAAVPADNPWRNFVAEREQHGRRMIGQLANLLDDLALDASRQLPIVEEGDVLRPGEPDHHAEPVARRFIEQVAAGRRVDADRVAAELRHQAEVGRNLLCCRELIPCHVRRERSVGDAFYEEAPAAGTQKLPIRDNAPLQRAHDRVKLNVCTSWDSYIHVDLRCSPWRGEALSYQAFGEILSFPV
jgi:hypothetical protein